MILKNTLLVVLLCCFYSNLQAGCTTETEGLCTLGTTTETSGSEVTDTIVIHQDSGDLLESGSDFIATSKEGDMDLDWGGSGPASMKSGSSCYGLGADKCAMITGSGNSTSKMGVQGMGTTFTQTIDISDLSITHGGETNYTIKVDKQDPADRIYMNVTGKYGNTQVFTGTDILSESGVTSGYQQYSGSFDFSGFLNSIIVEVGGRDISLAVGPVFDDVSINVLYNVVTTIVNQQIQELEEFLVLDYGQDANDVAEMIFENNDVTDDFNFEPIESTTEEFSFESVEMEMQEFEMDFQMDMDMEYDMPDIVMMPTNMEMDMEMPMEITVASVEMDIEMEMDFPEPQQMEIVNVETTEKPTMDMQETMEEEPIVETSMDNEPTEPKPESTQEDTQEPEMEPESETTEPEPESEPEETKQEPEEVEAEQEPEPEPEEVEEEVEEPKKEIKKEPKKEPTAKQKAATKIVKDMGDKGRYEAGNQIKTLIVMNILSNSKDFFDVQQNIPNIEGFFNNDTLPDTSISDNNIAGYILFGGSNTTYDKMVEAQYK